MSIITRFLNAVVEPQFKLARDLTAMAIADGQVTAEEKEAISALCHMEGVDESRLLEALKGGYDHAEKEIPDSQRGREAYLRDIIRIIGADGYAAPQEIYLLQIIASKMGLNQMDVIGLFMATTTRRFFKGDEGARIFASFLKNHIDPKSKTEKDNRENLRKIYDTVACHTETHHDEELDRELLRQNLARATETFLENTILTKAFLHVGLDFAEMARQEELRIFRRYGA